jgi:predicted dehydrogenase
MGSDFADDAARIGVYTHAGAYAACPDTRLVAVCDADAARAARCAARWHVPDSFTDVGRMLDTARPELVSICTPDETHAGMLLQVLAADGVRGILMEKPLALSGQDAARLVRLAERRGVTLAVNYSRRYAPGHQRLAALVQAGRIGRLQAVTGCYGKGTLHNGTHWFDLLRWFAGEVVQAQGWAGPDALTHSARLTLASGAVACLQATDARSFTVF